MTGQIADSFLPAWLLTGLCWLLAAEFVLLSPFKFLPRGIRSWPGYPKRFMDWGFPPWFSYMVGAAELFAGIMLLFPSRRFLGAVTIVITLVGAMVTHQINHDKLSESISAPIHFLLAALVALSTWPGDWRDPISVRAADSNSAISLVVDNVVNPMAREPRAIFVKAETVAPWVNRLVLRNSAQMTKQ
jgi:uncharacterized membrane protein YphA (DoxX/SURF4 family)